jgi:hypothetical protein
MADEGMPTEIQKRRCDEGIQEFRKLTGINFHFDLAFSIRKDEGFISACQAKSARCDSNIEMSHQKAK